MNSTFLSGVVIQISKPFVRLLESKGGVKTLFLWLTNLGCVSHIYVLPYQERSHVFTLGNISTVLCYFTRCVIYFFFILTLSVILTITQCGSYCNKGGGSVRFWLEPQGQAGSPSGSQILWGLEVDCVCVLGKAEGHSGWWSQGPVNLLSTPMVSLGKSSWTSVVRMWVKGDWRRYLAQKFRLQPANVGEL